MLIMSCLNNKYIYTNLNIMTTIHFILSVICIGVANTCIEWFIIGFLFHKSQALTPGTWKPESNKSYMYSTLLSFLFGALFTLFYWKIGSHYIMAGNICSNIKLGLICFAAFSFILEMSNAIYIPSLLRTSASVLPPVSFIRRRLSTTSPRSCWRISSARA